MEEEWSGRRKLVIWLTCFTLAWVFLMGIVVFAVTIAGGIDV